MINNTMVFTNNKFMSCRLTCVIGKNDRVYFLVSDVLATIFNLKRVSHNNVELIINSKNLIWVDIKTSKDIGLNNGYYLVTKTGLFTFLCEYKKKNEIAKQYSNWVNTVVFPSIDKALYERRIRNKHYR